LNADVILMDERPGRAFAHRLGLHTTGVLSLLVDAKAQGLVPLVAPLLDKLRDTIDFRMSEALRSRILADAGEL
jgi:predicted nucleic acid-binding protein